MWVLRVQWPNNGEVYNYPMSRYRPQRATGAKDANHWIVRDFLRDICGGFQDVHIGNDTLYMANFRGNQVGAIDTSRLGGFYLDWLCFAGGRVALVEIKTVEAYRKDYHSLQPGEMWTIQNLPLKTAVLFDDAGVIELYAELCGLQ